MGTSVGSSDSASASPSPSASEFPALEPIGTLTAYVGDGSWAFPDGPFGGRSVTHLEKLVWEGEHFNAQSVWANGTFLEGERVFEPEIRTMLRTDDDVLIYMDYTVRGDYQSFLAGQSRTVLAGKFEAPEGSAKYSWMNTTQVVGLGTFDLEALVQRYTLSVIR